MNSPVLPWHLLAADDVMALNYPPGDARTNIARCVAAHDPHAAQQQVAQHEATVRLLRRAAAALYAAPYPEYEKLSDAIRAHLRTLRGKGGAT